MEKRRWDQLEYDFIKRYAHCMTAREIGDRISRSEEAVYHKARDLGVSLKKVGRYTYNSRYSAEDESLAKALRAEGCSLNFIAMKLELPKASIRTICKGMLPPEKITHHLRGKQFEEEKTSKAARAA